MDILDQSSPGVRLMSVIRHLPTNADARISSKAALFVGRRVNDPAWTERQLATENQRLRANALEASWGTRSEAAVGHFRDCVGDASPRVAGNALIGLHLAGCPGVPERAVAMSESAEPGLRSTAAWVMGRIGDPAFIMRLTALLRDENPLVRSTSVRSLVEIRRAEKKRVAAIAAHPEVKPAEAKVVEPAAPEPPAEKIEAAVEARLPEAPFELRLDGSSFKAGKRR
jgi:HEAT repeat protein